MAINSIGMTGVARPADAGRAATSATTPDDIGFAEALNKLINNVEETAGSANKAVTGMVNGTTEVHEAMIALHEAEEAVEITVAVRNKFVQAYQDIMRMAL